MPLIYKEADNVHLKALKLHQNNKCTEKLITYTTSNCINSNTRRDIQRRYIHVGNNSGVFAEHADLWLYACLRGRSDWSLMNLSLVSSYYQVTQIWNHVEESCWRQIFVSKHIHTDPVKYTYIHCRPLSFSQDTAAEDWMVVNWQAGMKQMHCYIHEKAERHSSCFTDMRRCEQQQEDVRESNKTQFST